MGAGNPAGTWHRSSWLPFSRAWGRLLVYARKCRRWPPTLLGPAAGAAMEPSICLDWAAVAEREKKKK